MLMSYPQGLMKRTKKARRNNMRTIEIKLFQYDELPTEDAKEKAREWFAQGLFDFEWWNCIYEDAENIGLKITSFDCYQHEIDGKLQTSVNEVARKIRAEHGKQCGTYKLAMTVDLHKANDDEDQIKEFKRALLQEYLAMLDREAEYMESRESIEENIRCNEYEFTEDGRRA
jgi:hypothetical protein